MAGTAASRTYSDDEARIAASLGRRASAAAWLGRGEMGRQSPMIASRPEGVAQSASSLKAMARADEDTSDRLATSAIAAAFPAPPSRKLALRTRRAEGQGGIGRDRKRGQGGHRGGDRHVIDRPGGFQHESRIGIVHELGDFRGPDPSQSK